MAQSPQVSTPFQNDTVLNCIGVSVYSTAESTAQAVPHKYNVALHL